MAPENELPRYHQSLSPTLLCLDGGATRVITEIYLLSEIMHRLHWDLNLFRPKAPTSSPSCSTKPPTPSDCFDYIGCGGTSTVIAFLLACGYSAEETRDRFIQLAPLFTDPHVNLGLELEAMVPRHVSMGFEGNLIVDFPARCAVWVDTPHERSCGVLIRRGEPIIAKLIPLVVSEIKRELKGQTTTLNHTLPFLQAICPVFDDCSVLLSLGSGDVPIAPPRSSTPPPRSYSPIQFLPNPLSWWSASTPETIQPSLPTLPACRPTLQDIRTLSKYIPTYAYGTSYIRLQPSLTTWTINGEQGCPKDWESEKFGEHKMLVSGFVGRCENARSMDVVVEFLKRRDFESGLMRDESNDIQRLVYESARYY